MIYKTPLFEVPLYKLKASNHHKIKKWMMDNVYPEYTKTGVNDIDRNLYSSYFPGAPKLNQKEFTDLYAQDIESFLDKAGYSKLLPWERKFNFWYNLSFKGSYQEVHDHLGGPTPISYAAIHYVVFDKNEHSSTVFYNPLESILKTLQPTAKEKLLPTDFQSLQGALNVEEGDLIIFPSYVPHSVMTQVSERLRITVAFNISVYEKESHE